LTILFVQEQNILFKAFDTDCSGGIDFDEFIVRVRGPMNDRRKSMIKLAFSRLDKNGNGEVEPDDIISTYDASRHPDVLAGKRTADDILREFLDTFDVGGVKDGVVTFEEFENYYANLSASIDSDDYFELMIRNAWHISGGTGAAANSANRRVLVTHADGRQTVEEIQNDLGVRAGDKEEMMSRLRGQGVKAGNIDMYGNIDDSKPATKVRGFGQRTRPDEAKNPITGFGESGERTNRSRKSMGTASQISFG
jgi:calcyphosin